MTTQPWQYEYAAFRRDTRERSPIFTGYGGAAEWAVEKLRPIANQMNVTWYILRRNRDGGTWETCGDVRTRRYKIVGEGPNIKGVPWPTSSAEKALL